MSFAKSNSFTSSFPTCISFISFSCMIAVARISNSTFNKSGDGGQPYHVPDCKGNAFSFSLLCMMLAMGLSHMAFIMFSDFPSIPTFWGVFI